MKSTFKELSNIGLEINELIFDPILLTVKIKIEYIEKEVKIMDIKLEIDGIVLLVGELQEKFKGDVLLLKPTIVSKTSGVIGVHNAQALLFEALKKKKIDQLLIVGGITVISKKSLIPINGEIPFYDEPLTESKPLMIIRIENVETGIQLSPNEICGLGLTLISPDIAQIKNQAGLLLKSLSKPFNFQENKTQYQ